MEVNKEKLKTFLYLLMRDHVPCGEIEGIMVKSIGAVMEGSPNESFDFTPSTFSNKYLVGHIEDIIKRLS